MTKHVVSVSLGSSTRDKSVAIELGGVEIRAERRGVDGDLAAFNRLMRELDGTVDVLAVGGTEIAFHVDGDVLRFRSTDKLIEGVTCVVVNDLVEEDDVSIEDTDDWYAQDLDSNVWYCGEIAKNFETIEGDLPDDPELVDIDGSWKAGRDGAKPGILMLADPKVGDVYRQEVLLGDAEDVAEVISTTGSAKIDVDDASCDGDCLITRDFTQIEPGLNENKYYKPGVGLIIEVDMEGNRVELVEMTTH
jgi:hypothetical protein